MSRRDLFDDDSGAYARYSDPDTSWEAAAKVPVSEREARVLGALKAAGASGLTTHEIEDVTGLAAGTVTPRMKPLEEKGLVVRIGTRIPPGHTSRQTLWMAVKK